MSEKLSRRSALTILALSTIGSYRLLRSPNSLVTNTTFSEQTSNEFNDDRPIENRPQEWENFLQRCEVLDTRGNDQAYFLRLPVGGGEAFIIAANLDRGAMLYPLTANDAIPMQGDNNRRWWNNNQENLESPYAIAERHFHHPSYGTLIGAVTGDFFSEGIATYPEGPYIVADKGVLLPNPERSGIGIDRVRRIPYHGTYRYEDLVDANGVYKFEVMVGGGIPLILPAQNGIIKVANPQVDCNNETPEYTCFNAFGENFGSTLGYRAQNYASDTRSQTMVGFGQVKGLGNLLYTVVSRGVTQMQVAEQLVPICQHMMAVDGGSQASLQWFDNSFNRHSASFQQDSLPLIYGIYIK